ncbi:arsenate reductase family protein [Periweissella beninensis]|uniref:Arsenate reductase family protein n=1 Tax=Periweissella beninensis TaxID=504936 RepID=A0ABT0VJQ8_9LACO|nr:arsenate reductase family protein [Periweissella beninensis]MBM7543355.1 arsenate reductase [Periweissella beninensis]MCM2437348.1 arsenate reductase family protein [Periweissella beninensis]MCT4396028.1 arsenate reductase family protein [Periweissella beninensis]
MLFICYKKCSTCAKARKWLLANHFVFAERDIKDERPNVLEIKKWHHQSGLPLKRFFNTSGLVYRQLNLKAKLANLSTTEQYELLASDGMLVKRPILITDDQQVLVGFHEATWQACLKRTAK